MDVHYGQIVEKAVRRNGYSITELARLTNVNRRSVYNWFNQKRLKPEIIYRIGSALDYDFHNDLPQLFSPNDFQLRSTPQEPFKYNREPVAGLLDSNDTWKDKYIKLLEDFNTLLSVSPEAGMTLNADDIL